VIRNRKKKIHLNNFSESDTLQGGYRFLGLVLILLLLFLLEPSLLQAGKSSKAKGEFYALRLQCIKTLKNSKALGSHARVEGLSHRCMAFQKKYPTTRYAPRALYLSGMLWEGLYTHTKYVSDWNQSLRFYSRVIALYPESSLADDALFRRGVLYLKIGLSRLALTEFKKILYKYPKSDLLKVTKAHIRRLTHEGGKGKRTPTPKSCSSLVTFNGFRYWSNDRYARVVMDFSSKVPFHFRSVSTSSGTKLIFTLDEPFTLHCSQWKVRGKRGDFFKYAELHRGNYSSSVVVLFSAKAQSKVFTLVSPFRIVIDAIKGNKGKNNEGLSKPAPYRNHQDFLICLDPGHGGKDPGATGPHGVKEKDVVLRIARLLREKLVKKYGYKVIMTRNRDVYIPLEERVAFANSKGVDLSISIHINASRNRRLQGISTFCLSNTSDKKSLRLAARENGIPFSKMSNVDKILNDMLFSEKYNESYKVAHIIHKSLIQGARQYNPRVRNLGVRFAPFYVLAGAKMPSILLELDFISNPYVEKRLVHYRYINRLADGIAKGIVKTSRSINVARNYFN